MFDLGTNCMLLDIDSLEKVVISKKELLEYGMEVLHKYKFCEKDCYIERYVPAEHNVVINPTIITSFKCNYSCEYCFEKKHKKINSAMNPEDVQKIKEFYEIFCERTSFPFNFGEITVLGGEPLLPENRSVLESIAEMWSGQCIKITTNGTYLQNYMDFIVNNNVQLKVSLDGTKTVHYRRRKCLQRDAYDRAVEGIRQLVKNKVNVKVITVFESENVSDYPQFFDLLESLGWIKEKELSVGFIPEIGCGSDDRTTEQIINTITAYKKLKVSDERIKYVDARKLIPGSINLMTALNNANKNMYEPYRCSCLEKPDYAFFPDGKVHLCAAGSGKAGCIGRYKPDAEIDFEKIELFRKRRIDTISKCRKCTMKALCTGGCPVTSLAIGNDILEPYCGFWKNPVFLKYLEEVF